MLRFTRIACAAVLVAAVAMASAQDLGALLKDPKYPQKLRPADIPSDMTAVKIVLEKQGGGGDFFSMLMNPLMMMMGAFGQASTAESKPTDPNEGAAMDFFDRISISWTSGATVKLYGQEFLVTYAPQFNLAELSKSKNPPDLGKGELILTLVNTHSILSLSPRPDMTKEKWMTPPPVTVVPKESQQAETSSNLKQMALGMLMYSADFDDVIPYVQSSKGAYEVIMPYVKNKSIFKSANPANSAILMNMALAGVNPSEVPNPMDTVLFYEQATWDDGSRMVAFLDGHVKLVTATEWADLVGKLNAKYPKHGKPLPATLGSNWDG